MSERRVDYEKVIREAMALLDCPIDASFELMAQRNTQAWKVLFDASKTFRPQEEHEAKEGTHEQMD